MFIKPALSYRKATTVHIQYECYQRVWASGRQIPFKLKQHAKLMYSLNFSDSGSRVSLIHDDY